MCLWCWQTGSYSNNKVGQLSLVACYSDNDVRTSIKDPGRAMSFVMPKLLKVTSALLQKVSGCGQPVK